VTLYKQRFHTGTSEQLRDNLDFITKLNRWANEK